MSILKLNKYIIACLTSDFCWWQHKFQNFSKGQFIGFKLAERETNDVKGAVSLFLLKFLVTVIFWTKAFTEIRRSAKEWNHENSQKISFYWKIFNLQGTQFFFSACFFFHEHSRFTGQQGKGEGNSLSPLYHLHTRHRHIIYITYISRVITAESSRLHIPSSWTRTGRIFGFWAQVATQARRKLEHRYSSWVVAKTNFCIQGNVFASNNSVKNTFILYFCFYVQ